MCHSTPITLTILFLVSHFNFFFILCGRLQNVGVGSTPPTVQVDGHIVDPVTKFTYLGSDGRFPNSKSKI